MNSREEIRRLKAENPKMTHKEAFSTAAKNVSFSQRPINLSVDSWGTHIESFDMSDFFSLVGPLPCYSIERSWRELQPRKGMVMTIFLFEGVNNINLLPWTIYTVIFLV